MFALTRNQLLLAQSVGNGEYALDQKWTISGLRVGRRADDGVSIHLQARRRDVRFVDHARRERLLRKVHLQRVQNDDFSRSSLFQRSRRGREIAGCRVRRASRAHSRSRLGVFSRTPRDD
jgi:hypothetical protein